MEISSADEETEAVPGAWLSQGAAGASTSVQHFRVEPGATVPAHSHPHEQAGYLARGEGVFVVEGERRPVSAGDGYVIPGGETHALEVTGDEPVVGVDVFSPPRTDPDWASED
jgi:quercetin dioxygenase-like cupin family protein